MVQGGQRLTVVRTFKRMLSRNPMEFSKETFQKCLHKASPNRTVSRFETVFGATVSTDQPWL